MAIVVVFLEGGETGLERGIEEKKALILKDLQKRHVLNVSKKAGAAGRVSYPIKGGKTERSANRPGKK